MNDEQEVVPGQDDEQLSIQWGELSSDEPQEFAGDSFAWNPWQWDAQDTGC